MTTVGSLVLDLPSGWIAVDLTSGSGRRNAISLVAEQIPAAARPAAAWTSQLLDAGADWLLLPPTGRLALGLVFVHPASGTERAHCSRRQRRSLVDEKLILVDDLAVILAPVVDVVLAVCECSSTRSTPAAGDDDPPARSAADELIDAMGVMGQSA